MKMKYSFDWMKVGRWVGRQQMIGVLLLLLTVVSCAIENDIPYPIVEGRIKSFSVEGQRAAEGNQNPEAIIDNKARTVTLYVNDSVDISRLKITQLVCNPANATLLVDGSLCDDETKFPSTGFASLDSIPVSSNTRVDFTKPVAFTLHTYQDYVWTVTVKQIIDREILVDGMVDYVIDENSQTVLIWVEKDRDLSNLQVTQLALGGKYGSVYPDPTSITDYSSMLTFYVRYSWEDETSGTKWKVSVFHSEEESSIPTTGELSVNAWSKHAYVSIEETSAEGWTAEYSIKGKDSWTSVSTSMNGGLCEATLKGLSPNMTYTCRMKDKEGNVQATSDFTTESAIALSNGGFEDWYRSDSGIWYAATQAEVTVDSYLWDSSNSGSGAFGFNPTIESLDVKHGGNSSAKLETQYAVIKLAAASLYYGRFNELVGTKGAKIDFGQPITSRPTTLHGWFQYDPKVIDYVGENQPSGTVKKGDVDICSIYIALSKKIYTIDNTDISTFIQYATDDNIIAYGELPIGQCVDTGGQWKEFSIDLKYKTLERPNKMYLIIVVSSSKYGDYFTGAKGSTMYLDDFELIYGEEPVMWN
ncbi:PCMD domain-containing protein [Phocaeicola barnesiae]|uniref:PCMD domain-containing protein n=1 Tax=Phocaeicola barnesiae TaxID=376804 RepID=A0AAW5MWM4_9BACT|nr:PCMD domain-containing protein [Phocaeicola barnesiae]MCR8872841.1 PCMD domain-containing protein [Phocaeicola barnesiae]